MVLNSDLKAYQERLLDDFTAFLSRCRELKNPGAAFMESTAAFFGHALPYHALPSADTVPYVCLRVPTGGGKTRIAGQSIKRVNGSFLATDYSLVLWLVPSETIRDQTLYALKTKGELPHEDMRALFGAVHVLDINEALALQPAMLNTGNTIIVATMQSFKREGRLARVSAKWRLDGPFHRRIERTERRLFSGGCYPSAPPVRDCR